MVKKNSIILLISILVFTLCSSNATAKSPLEGFQRFKFNTTAESAESIKATSKRFAFQTHGASENSLSGFSAAFNFETNSELEGSLVAFSNGFDFTTHNASGEALTGLSGQFDFGTLQEIPVSLEALSDNFPFNTLGADENSLIAYSESFNFLTLELIPASLVKLSDSFIFVTKGILGGDLVAYFGEFSFSTLQQIPQSLVAEYGFFDFSTLNILGNSLIAQAGPFVYNTLGFNGDPLIILSPEFAFRTQNGFLMTLQGFSDEFPFNIFNDPLPVDLIFFDARKYGDGVLVEWQTATEINNDYFTVLRSDDGIVFSDMVHINGAGNSNQIINYSWKDQSPANGINYYQLKQTDYDGTTDYSNIIAVSFFTSENFYAFISGPFIHVVLPLQEKENIEYRLFDAMGRVMDAGNYRHLPGNTHLISAAHLSPGMIILNLTTRQDTFTKKLMVKNP